MVEVEYNVISSCTRCSKERFAVRTRHHAQFVDLGVRLECIVFNRVLYG